MTAENAYDLWDGWVHIQHLESMHGLMTDAIHSHPESATELMESLGAFSGQSQDARRDFIASRFTEADLFRRLETQAFLSIAFGVFEHTLVRICQSFMEKSETSITWSDLHGRPLEKAKVVVGKLAGKPEVLQGNDWERVLAVQIVRNRTLHNGGLYDRKDEITLLKTQLSASFIEFGSIDQQTVDIPGHVARSVSGQFKEFLERVNACFEDALA